MGAWATIGLFAFNPGVSAEIDMNPATPQMAPSVASNGTDYFVVWEDQRGGAANIYGTRISAAGVVEDIDGIAICPSPAAQLEPAIAWNGTSYLVVWRDNRAAEGDIYGARVTSAGVVEDPSGIAISTADNHQYEPRVAWDGSEFVVAWSDYRNAGVVNPYAARVSVAGEVLDPDGIQISTAEGQTPMVACAAGTCLVVSFGKGAGTSYNIYGARVISGVVQDPAGIAISTLGTSEMYPSVASDGTDFLVAWSDYRSGGGADLYGARVSSAGVLEDPNGLAISTSTDNESLSAVTWDGASYFAVWAASPSYDIHGAQISQAGEVGDPIAISVDPSNDYGPIVAARGAGEFLVTYSNLTADLAAARLVGAPGVTGASDAGVTCDGDACVPAAGDSSPSSGCGCETTSSRDAASLALVLGLLLRRRPR